MSNKINVLGAQYTIDFKDRAEDALLENADGYCDKTTKKIVVAKKDEECNLGDFLEYQKKVLRHEIIHAFLFESGLHENFEHSDCGHDETMIDWVAVQFSKMLQVFRDSGCI